jgi:Na+/phosphate symporter
MENLTNSSSSDNNNKNNFDNDKDKDKIDKIFNEIKSYIDDVKDYGLNENKRDEASSIISFTGMILDEISNAIKKSNLSNFNLEKIYKEDLDIELSNLLNQLTPYFSEKKVEKKLDEIAVYCDTVFMELMAGHSCAVPEKQ